MALVPYGRRSRSSASNRSPPTLKWRCLCRTDDGTPMFCRPAAGRRQPSPIRRKSCPTGGAACLLPGRRRDAQCSVRQQPVDDLSGHARLVLNGVADHYLGNVVVFVRLGGGSSEVTSVHPVSSPSTGSAAVVERSTIVPLGDGLVHPFSTSLPRSRYFVCRLPEVDTTSYLAHGPTPVIRSTVMWVM